MLQHTRLNTFSLSVCVCVYSQLFDLLSGFETSGRAILLLYRDARSNVSKRLYGADEERGAVEPDGAMSP
jgi:hypothetical protein